MKKYILYLTIVLIMILASCNSEGTGIFFQISQEVAQITSEISELSVRQVVEVGSNVYALTGRQVWLQNGNSWKNVGKNNFIYDIVEYSGVLYGNINNDDDHLDDGKIMSYNPGTNSWTLVDIDNYGTEITLFEANDNYVLLKETNDILTSNSDLDDASFISSTLSGMLILDGASNGTIDILISENNIYENSFGAPMTEQLLIGDATGVFRAITVDTSNNFYLSTISGEIFKSDTTGRNWLSEGSISTNIPTKGALEVVNIGDEFLIIGTNNGYYEMNITSAGSIVGPTETTSNSEFDTSYPELADGLVHEVYASSAEANVFYLATANGLWKRIADGTFHKQ